MGPDKMLDRRRFLTVAGTVACGLPLAGAISSCGKGNPSADEDGGNVSIIAAGSELGSAGVMRQALKIAAEEEQDVSVTIKNMAQGTALLSMRKGSVQTAMMSWINLATFEKQGTTAVGIAPAWASHSSILVKKDSDYRKVEDIKGLRVVTPERVTGVYSETRLVLQKYFGFDFEKECKVTPMGESPVAIALFKKGEFDVYIDSEPVVSVLLADGTARELLQVGTYEAEQRDGAFVPVNSWGVRKEWLEESGPERLAQLFRKATEIARTKPESYDAAAKAGKMSAAAAKLFRERFSKLLVPEYTEENLKSASEDMAEAKKYGIIDFDVDPTKLVWQQ